MLRIVTKRELLHYISHIDELRAEIVRLHGEVKHERDRAERAVNALLAKHKAPMIQLGESMSIQEQDEIQQAAYDLFNDGRQFTEKDALEELQK